LKFLDLSGYAFSGKSAMSDLISEHSGFFVPSYRVEFDLLRIPNGLMSLKDALCNDWSWLRSDRAIRDFINLVEVLDRSPSNPLEKIFKPGFNYSAKYKNFLEESRVFVEAITLKTWKMQLPYDLPSLGILEHAKLRILSKLRKKYAWPEIEYRLSSGDNFLDEARKYLYRLLTNGHNLNNMHTIVAHNMLDPINPQAMLCFFENIKSIVVDRDIRDIYITALSPSKGFNDDVSMYSKITGACDIDLFIARQRLAREKTNYTYHQNILRFQFEMLALDYENSCIKVREFLGIPESDHTLQMQRFNPEVSRKNIGLWRNATGQTLKSINKLEKAIPDGCFEFTN
jgi:hypothetical protein